MDIVRLKQYREELIISIYQINEDYEATAIDHETYTNLYDKYTNEIKNNDKKISQLSFELYQKNYKPYIISSILLLLIIGALFFLEPTITGFTTREPQDISINGYQNEGKKWTDIKGSGLYERCLLVNSKIDYNSILIRAKVAVVNDNENLGFRIYDTDDSNNPDNKLGYCTVKSYSNNWKSCTIDNLDQKTDNYWICAYSEGEEDETNYIISYNNEDNYLRAFWTGNYWQKLEDSSYTIQAEFKKW